MAKALNEYKIPTSKLPVALRIFNLGSQLKRRGFIINLDINDPKQTELIYQLESISYIHDEIFGRDIKADLEDEVMDNM